MTNTFALLSAAALALAAAPLAASAQAADGTWTATLAPLNATAAGSETSGTATFTASGDTLTITVEATGTPPEVMHLQHFHGFADGDQDAQCPTEAADTNGDGVIDLIETEPMAGTTMVPFQGDPADMQIAVDSYPTSDASGAYSYEKSVSLKALDAAFAKAFSGQTLDLERRVVFIHGVAADTALPATAQSLGTISAQVTLPIACGVIQKSGG